jgi:hypothetical protein
MLRGKNHESLKGAVGKTGLEILGDQQVSKEIYPGRL